LAQGLEALLADEARSTFQHLRQREVLWRAEDPVERGLWRATLHAESLADFEGMRRTRTQLGRTRLLRGAREGQAPDAEAFRLLVHGGNPQEVVRAARWYRSRGPADVLAEAVDTVATLPWPAPDEQATVELLHAAGDLLHPAQTNDVTDHLLDLATGAGPALARAYAVDDAALRALAQVTHGAEPDSLESIAQRLLGFLEATQRPLIIRDVSAVVQTIRWQELSATTTEPWRAFAEDETPGPDETDSLRAAVVLQLAKVDAAWAVAVALAAYERRPTLLWAAVAVDIGMPLPEELVEQMTRRAVEALGDERDEAAEGRHRLGEVEPADLLCALLLRHPTQPGWHQLVQYVSDPATNVEGTGRVADRLAHGLPSLDASVADEIRALFGEGPLELWGTDANAFQHRRVVPRGPSLRLSLALSAGESDQWSAELIALAGSTEDEDRFEAAWTSASAAALPQTAGFVAYLLTRDRTPEVRAAAGQAILKLLAATSAGQSVAHSAHLLTQVKTLLREPGVTAPFAVLRGLVAAGAHTADLLAAAGIQVPLKPYRVQALTGSPDYAGPMVYDATAGFYARPHPAGLLAGDGTEPVEADPDDWARDGDDWFVAETHERLARRLGVDLGVERAWAGLCVATPDRDPLVGAVAEGVYVAAGWQGHGFMRSPALGEAAAQAILGGDPVPGFDPDRFDGDEAFEIVEGMAIDEP
jgi:glycine/D-amino acid oxidase-like deaminating enzyme